MTTLPTLFVSHGAPTLALDSSPARHFLKGLAESLPRVRAALTVSAHWETATPRLSVAREPENTHNFPGFPDALYRIEYPAPDVAAQATALIEGAGLGRPDTEVRGLDHGAWVPPESELWLRRARDGRLRVLTNRTAGLTKAGKSSARCRLGRGCQLTSRTFSESLDQALIARPTKA